MIEESWEVRGEGGGEEGRGEEGERGGVGFIGLLEWGVFLFESEERFWS